MKTISRIKVKREVDEYTEFPWLGRYTNKYETGTISRSRFSKRYSRGQYEWYIPANHWPHDPRNWDHVSEEDKAKVIHEYGSLKKADWCYALRDMDRLDSMGEDWVPIGIFAEAEVVVHSVIQRIRSAGLWGIESDSDEEYLRSVEKDELDELTKILVELGFSESDMPEVEQE